MESTAFMKRGGGSAGYGGQLGRNKILLRRFWWGLMTVSLFPFPPKSIHRKFDNLKFKPIRTQKFTPIVTSCINQEKEEKEETATDCTSFQGLWYSLV